jgi:exopolysaccharide production repressor protein
MLRREEFAHDFGRTNACERHGGIEMSFLLFLRGLILVLLVFGITTYVVTQSLWATFIQTVLCAVLLQIGYFAAVLFLVWRSAGTRKIEESTAKNEAVQGSPTKDQPAGKVGRLPRVPRSRHR